MQQFAVVEVEVHQRVGFDPHPDLAAGQDLRSHQDHAAEGDGAAAGHDPVDLDRRPRVRQAVAERVRRSLRHQRRTC
jgi:hypothetical protein